MRAFFVTFSLTLLLVGFVQIGCFSTGEGTGLSKLGVTAETHTAFPLRTGSKHASTTCNDCHGSFDTFKQFVCTDCHSTDGSDPMKPPHDDQAKCDARHAGVSGYVYDSAACYSCHPEGSTSTVNHEAFFPISSGNHAGLACNTCHIDPADRAVLGCITCHSTDGSDPLKPPHDDKAKTDTRHVAVSGYVYESHACYTCHPQGTLAGSADHEPIFQIGTGQKHNGIACNVCHADVADHANVTCLTASCHTSSPTASAHTKVPDYSFTSAKCLDCHMDPSPVFRVSNHNNCYGHQGEKACTTVCHTADTATGKPFATRNFGIAHCTSSGCHRSDRGTNCND